MTTTDLALQHQADPLNRTRLRWRARRGLLENDLIVTRFLDKHELNLTDSDVLGLTQLLELPDNELLDLLLKRQPPSTALQSPAVLNVLDLLQNS